MGEYRQGKAELNRRQRFKERARAEYIAGAEEESRRRTGRSMTTVELQRVLRRYPGDLERRATIDPIGEVGLPSSYH